MQSVKDFFNILSLLISWFWHDFCAIQMEGRRAVLLILVPSLQKNLQKYLENYKEVSNKRKFVFGFNIVIVSLAKHIVILKERSD